MRYQLTDTARKILKVKQHNKLTWNDNVEEMSTGMRIVVSYAACVDNGQLNVIIFSRYTRLFGSLGLLGFLRVIRMSRVSWMDKSDVFVRNFYAMSLICVFRPSSTCFIRQRPREIRIFFATFR